VRSLLAIRGLGSLLNLPGGGGSQGTRLQGGGNAACYGRERAKALRCATLGLRNALTAAAGKPPARTLRAVAAAETLLGDTGRSDGSRQPGRHPAGRKAPVHSPDATADT